MKRGIAMKGLSLCEARPFVLAGSCDSRRLVIAALTLITSQGTKTLDIASYTSIMESQHFGRAQA